MWSACGGPRARLEVASTRRCRSRERSAAAARRRELLVPPRASLPGGAAPALVGPQVICTEHRCRQAAPSRGGPLLLLLLVLLPHACRHAPARSPRARRASVTLPLREPREESAVLHRLDRVRAARWTKPANSTSTSLKDEGGGATRGASCSVLRPGSREGKIAFEGACQCTAQSVVGRMDTRGRRSSQIDGVGKHAGYEEPPSSSSRSEPNEHAPREPAACPALFSGVRAPPGRRAPPSSSALSLSLSSCTQAHTRSTRRHALRLCPRRDLGR